MLTDDQVKKFQLLYKKRFGVEIGEEEAQEKGQKFMRLIELISRPGDSGRHNTSDTKTNQNHEA